MAVGQEHHVNNPFTAEEIETGLMAMIAWAGNASAASRYLKAEKKLDVSASTLNGWKRTHAPRYLELSEKYQDQMEDALAHEFREVAAVATQAERLAVEKAVERLEKGQDQDPARSAASLSKVKQVNTDKLMTLTQRPTTITETRNADEIIRSLVAKGVLAIPEETGVDGDSG